MAKNPLIPFFTGHDVVSGTVTGAEIVGKTFVSFATGGRGGLPSIATAAADTRPAGVAAHDGAVGDVIPFHSVGYLPVTAAEDLLVNDRVKVGANGRAAKLGVDEEHLAVGTVYVGAANGADAAIKLD